MPPLPDPAVLVLPALAVAAGVDLYLTLFLLGAAGATALWPPLPGALGDLASPGVLAVTGVFYLAELTADRSFGSALVWNTLHAAIRPLAGALLALLVLDGHGPGVQLGGALGVAVVASAAHAVATGGSLLLRLDAAPPVRPGLAAVAEDVAVLGLVALALDRPAWSAGATGLLLVGALPLAGSQLRAFVFSLRTAAGRLRRILVGGAWTRPGRFPRWLRRALAGETMAPGGLRGAPGAALRLPGRPRLVLGWLVVRGDTPVFVHGPSREARLDLGEAVPTSLEESGFLRTVTLGPPKDAGGEPPRLLLPRDGPSAATLRAELGLAGGAGGTPPAVAG